MLGRVLSLLCFAICLLPPPAFAQSPKLTITGRDATRTYTREQLLAHPAVRTVTINDPLYRRAMDYRAIPIAELLKGIGIGPDDYVEARGTDDFAIGIPGNLLSAANLAKEEAFLAIEDPAAPWPPIADKKDGASAGPFYIVWRLSPSANVSSEYWSFRLAALAVTDSPFKRWPVLGVGAEVPPDDPIRVGLDRFVGLCMACHRFNGAGEGTQGPDLGRPMNPTQYFQIPALKKLIRDPSSVRQLPDQKMPGFDQSRLSDRDLDAIVDWLAYKAKQNR
jgi:mono/diheme cytochrome c family protein